MGLKALDGFDHYNSLTDMNASRGFLQYSCLNSGFVAGRYGGKAFEVGSFFACTFGQRVAEAGIGIACNSADITVGGGGSNGGEYHFQFTDTVANVTQVTVQFIQSNGSIRIYRGQQPPFAGTLLYTSENNLFVHATRSWMYVEIWLKIDNITGYVDVRIDGKPVVSLTGVDTQNSANAWWDAVSEIRETNGLNLWLDDFYYCDTSVDAGAYPNNSPLGDLIAATLFEVGTDSVQWAPQPGTNANYQNVNETAMDSDTSYNFSGNPGDEDRFNFQALPNVVGAIFAVAVTSAGRKDDAGARTYKNLIKSGSTEDLGALNSLPDTSYSYFTDIWLLNPDTGLNWTVTDLNAIRAGYQLIA